MAQYVSNLKLMSNRINNDNEFIRGILDSSTNDYDTLLNIVAEKYALIGSFVFPKDDVHTAKLSVESYFELFSSIENLDDVKEWLSQISGKTISDTEVKATAVKVWRFASAASQLMSRPADNFWAHRYLTLAQWILSDDSLSEFSCKSIHDIIKCRISRDRLLAEEDIHRAFEIDTYQDDSYDLYS